MHRALYYIHLTSLELCLKINIIIPVLKLRKLCFSFLQLVNYNLPNDTAKKW